MSNQKIPTLPPFGEVVPGQGGRLGAIMRGAMVGTVRQPDYAIILASTPDAILKWGEYTEVKGADSLTDGAANTAAMLKAKCPPALHASKLLIDGHQDFYVPARAELWALRANVPELFEKQLHWSSTQNDRCSAFYQSFEYGHSLWSIKVNELRVRACRRIPLYHFPA